MPKALSVDHAVALAEADPTAAGALEGDERLALRRGQVGDGGRERFEQQFARGVRLGAVVGRGQRREHVGQVTAVVVHLRHRAGGTLLPAEQVDEAIASEIGRAHV